MTEFRRSCLQDIPQLKALWFDGFEDDERFLDLFFSAAYSPSRSMVAVEQGQIVSGLYWFDCSVGEEKLAYIYAVATRKACSGKGYASGLLSCTHDYLAKLGYSGAILSPGEESLFRFYEKFGYQVCSYHHACVPKPGSALPLTPVTAEAYSKLRSKYAPEGSVHYSESAFPFLEEMAELYAGNGFICALSKFDRDLLLEVLPDLSFAAGIAAALGRDPLTCRAPGTDTPYAMALAFPGKQLPEQMYLGFAFE